MDNQEQQIIQPQVSVQTVPEPIPTPVEPKKSLPKWPLIIAGLILIIILVGSAFTLGKNLNTTQKSASKTVQNHTPTPTPASNVASADPTASWKTHTSSSYEFSYPSDWKLDKKLGFLYSPNWDFNSSYIATKGSSINFGASKTNETSIQVILNKPHGGFPQKNIRNVIVDGVSAIESETDAEHIIISTIFIKNHILYSFSLESATTQDNERDLTTYHQLLSTFKFTQ